MQPSRLSSYKLILVCFVGWQSTVNAANTTTLVGQIKNQRAIRGCSWSATSSALGKGLVFLAEYDESKVLMHIDGQDTELKTDKTTSDQSLNKVGNTIQRTYRGPGVVVTAVYTATRLCPKDSESCEVTAYTVTYTVSKNGQQQIVQAQGSLGC